MKKIRCITKYSIVYIISIILFIILLIATSSFPASWIEENVKKSANILKEETNFKEVKTLFKTIYMDNHTDSLMVNTAYSIDNLNPFYSAFIARKNYIPGKTKIIYEETVGELGYSEEYKERDQSGELYDIVNGKVLESFEYSRYWHGYLILLRPLLIFFNVKEIRILLTILICILGVIVLYLIGKKINIITGIIFFISLTSVNYWYMGISLQGSWIFIISMVFAIIILRNNKKIKNFPMMFFIIGILTNFFDFLTVPILTLGIPLIIYFLMQENNTEFIKIIKKIMQISISWLLGYALTWLGKWILLQMIFDKNIFDIVLKQILYRMSCFSNKENINYIEVLLENYKWTMGTTFINLMVIYLYTFVKLFKNKTIKIKITLKIFPYFLISLVPFIWYFVVRNHSYNHAFFTYRNLLLTILGISLSFYKLISWRDLK